MAVLSVPLRGLARRSHLPTYDEHETSPKRKALTEAQPSTHRDEISTDRSDGCRMLLERFVQRYQSCSSITGTMIVPSAVQAASPHRAQIRGDHAVTTYVDHSTASQSMYGSRRDRTNEPGCAGHVDDV